MEDPQEDLHYEDSVQSEITLNVPTTHTQKRRVRIMERLSYSPLKKDPSIGIISPKRMMEKVAYNIKPHSRKQFSHTEYLESKPSSAPKWDSTEEVEKRKAVREQRVTVERCKTANISNKRDKKRREIFDGLELQREQVSIFD
jgi:hypothetical protein